MRIDGDLYNDRTLLIGGEDGRVRRWGVDSSGNVPKNDEVTTTTDKAIDSYVLMGPLVQAPISAAQPHRGVVRLGGRSARVQLRVLQQQHA